MRRQKAIFISLVALAGCFLPLQVSATESVNTDWVSDATIASVVQLGRVYRNFLVEGMPDDHIVTLKNGKPDFGDGKAVGVKIVYRSVGSGVFVSPDGWIFSNAHVADDKIPGSIRIRSLMDDEGNEAKGDSGLPLKAVAVPLHRGFMWVTVTNEENVRNNIRQSNLSFLAKTAFIDHDYSHLDRDRAVLKIVAHARTNPSNGLPEAGETYQSDRRLPISKLGNPFDVPIREPEVRSLGYPGIGPKQFPSLTKGEYLGPLSDKRAQIAHTAFIAGGNSGGGLFYKDALIGINTWSSRDPGTGRHLAIAQPNTYWGYPVVACKLWYGARELPVIQREWVEKDPSRDPYKKIIYVGLNVRSKSDDSTPVRNATLVAFRREIAPRDAVGYLKLRNKVQKYSAVTQMKNRDFDTAKICKILDLPTNTVERWARLPLKEFLDGLPDAERKYVDALASDGFFAEDFRIDKDGQTVMSVPPGREYALIVFSKGYRKEKFSYRAGNEQVQGPMTLRLMPR